SIYTLAQSPCSDGKILLNGNLVDAVSIENTNNTGLKLPLWLSAGTTLAAAERVLSISVIEFDITVVNGANTLQFNRVLSVDTSQQTVPSGKTWKVESIVKHATIFNSQAYASSNSPICVGDTLKLSAPAINGASYQWS